LTRGQKIGKEELASFVEGLEKVPPQVKERMGQLSPDTYVGLAESLVDTYFREK
jgi:adenylosuccinate lyase